MHIQGIDTQVIRREVDTGKHLGKRQMLAVTEQDDLVRVLFHPALDEAQQVLLVHGRRVVHVGVYFPDVVKVSVRHLFAVGRFLVLVEQRIQVEFALEVLQTPKCKALARPVRRGGKDPVEIHVKLPDGGNWESGRLRISTLKDLVDASVAEFECQAVVVGGQRHELLHVEHVACFVAGRINRPVGTISRIIAWSLQRESHVFPPQLDDFLDALGNGAQLCRHLGLGIEEVEIGDSLAGFSRESGVVEASYGALSQRAGEDGISFKLEASACAQEGYRVVVRVRLAAHRAARVIQLAALIEELGIGLGHLPLDDGVVKGGAVWDISWKHAILGISILGISIPWLGRILSITLFPVVRTHGGQCDPGTAVFLFYD